MEKFQENIKKWVALDTQLKTLNEHSKNIRNEKNELNESIMNFVETNNLSQSTVKITDGRLKFSQTKQTAPITLGFLEMCLSELFNNEDQVNSIMEHIKNKRETKYVSDIKRYYSN